MRKILIVEDEKDLGNIILKNLQDEGFEVKIVYDGKNAMETFYDFSPELVLLDITLPNKNGWEICREIREISEIPVIIMTARDSELDEIKGLELGAEDYITKPFALKLLILRVKKQLKIDLNTEYKFGSLVFKPQNYILMVDDAEEILTKREVDILEYFFKHKGKVISRETLLNEVWGFDFDGEDRAVDTLIKRLRKKMGQYSESIKSVRGVGYVFSEKES
ncbi:MAG: response regulator transcription factor [Fusobacteriaceae bacterium]